MSAHQGAVSELDLDALERQITNPRAHALTMFDGATILAITGRLREAEQAVADEFEYRVRAEARIAQLELVIEEHEADFDRRGYELPASELRAALNEKPA